MWSRLIPSHYNKVLDMTDAQIKAEARFQGFYSGGLSRAELCKLLRERLVKGFEYEKQSGNMMETLFNYSITPDRATVIVSPQDGPVLIEISVKGESRS